MRGRTAVSFEMPSHCLLGCAEFRKQMFTISWPFDFVNGVYEISVAPYVRKNLRIKVRFSTLQPLLKKQTSLIYYKVSDIPLHFQFFDESRSLYLLQRIRQFRLACKRYHPTKKQVRLVQLQADVIVNRPWHTWKSTRTNNPQVKAQ